MKNPLRYQMSEYDCGPTTMLNAISYLFPREIISPEVIRNIMPVSYTHLDVYKRQVEPYEMTALEIEKGKDYCTLVTCTPYGINTPVSYTHL